MGLGCKQPATHTSSWQRRTTLRWGGLVVNNLPHNKAVHKDNTSMKGWRTLTDTGRTYASTRNTQYSIGATATPHNKECTKLKRAQRSTTLQWRWRTSIDTGRTYAWHKRTQHTAFNKATATPDNKEWASKQREHEGAPHCNTMGQKKNQVA